MSKYQCPNCGGPVCALPDRKGNPSIAGTEMILTCKRFVNWRRELAVIFYRDAELRAQARCWQGPLSTLLAADPALGQAVIERVIATIPEHYPATVFTPLEDAEVKVLVDAMTATGIRHPSDRLHAQWGRHLRQLFIDDLRASGGEGAE